MESGELMHDSETRPFDSLIGRLDRILSEFLVAASITTVDEADRQTLRHHADDLIGVGRKALELLTGKKIETYTCSHCGVASPKDEWGPGHVRCPRCTKIERAASEAR